MAKKEVSDHDLRRALKIQMKMGWGVIHTGRGWSALDDDGVGVTPEEWPYWPDPATAIIKDYAWWLENECKDPLQGVADLVEKACE